MKTVARIKIDLKKLPLWQQYVIAVAVVAAVFGAAWAFAGERRVPEGVYDYVVPVGGGFGIFAVLYLLVIGGRK